MRAPSPARLSVVRSDGVKTPDERPVLSISAKHAEPDYRALIPRFSVITGKQYAPLKRFLDASLVFVSLPLVLPIALLIMIAIKIEDPRAPVLFSQQRTGLGGRRFAMFKFRSMIVNAEELKTQLAKQNELSWPDFKIAEDPRITRVGRILRKTSLDELPQLLNVMSGSMSLIGPRPTSFSSETYHLWQSERLEIRPGISGLWQVARSDNLQFEERVRLDIAYIRNLSFALDFKILWLTLPAALKGT